MTDRNELIALWTAAKAADAKVKRNAHKLAWMDATRRMADVVLDFEPQLARYVRDARIAAEAFGAAAMGLDTETIVSIITEAEGVAA